MQQDSDTLFWVKERSANEAGEERAGATVADVEKASAEQAGAEQADLRASTAEEAAERSARRRLGILETIPPHFHAVALSEQVTGTPQSVQLFGMPLVLYRDPAGKPVAHVDRCPHRNAPLSSGRLCDDGTLECPYHGWRFNQEGLCTMIPGLTGAPRESHRVESFVVREAAGIVFVNPKRTEPQEALLIPEESESRKYTRLTRAVTFPGSLHAVVENALDVPHTSILHRGLFRSGKRHRVKVTLKRFQTFAEATYEGEPPPSGLLARLLSFGAGTKGPLVVSHWDRFFLPGVLQVEYRLGPKTHILVTGYLSPVTGEETRLFARVCLRLPLPTWLTTWLATALEPFFMRIVEQDLTMLSLQSENVRRFGGAAFMSTELDVLGASVTRLLKEQSARDEGGEAVDLRLSPSASETPREERTFEMDA